MRGMLRVLAASSLARRNGLSSRPRKDFISCPPCLFVTMREQWCSQLKSFRLFRGRELRRQRVIFSLLERSETGIKFVEA
jgi:hypothetical protein